TGADLVFQRPDGKQYDFLRVEFNNDNLKPGNAGVDEGYIVGGAAFSYNWDIALPEKTDNNVLVFHFTVKKDVTVAATEITFIDGAQSRFFTNSLVPGVEPFPSDGAASQPATVLVGAALRIVSAPSFQRGDSNGDGKLDLSD